MSSTLCDCTSGDVLPLVAGVVEGWIGDSVPNTSPEEEIALSLRDVLDGALVFLRGLSRVRCSSLGLSGSSSLTGMTGFGLGGGAGTLDVYIV